MTISSMKLKKKLISQAIDVLRETKNQNVESEKKALFEDDSSSLFLQVMLKKIPKKDRSQMIKVNLPHSLIKDTDEICLITGDTNKSDRKAEIEPDVLLYEALLNKHGVTQVSKVVTLRQLRTDYKPYADKQKLLAAYDVFLADDKIYECLPRVLGKFFYKKRKFPLKINMKSPNLKQQIEKALSTKRFYVTGNGNSCCSEVAYLNMSNSEILANIMETINTLSKEMPGAWDNIMGIYLKTARSKAIPIYMSYDNPNDVVLPDEETNDEIIMDELSTKPNVSVKIHKDGKVEIFSSKKCQETCFDEVKLDSQEKKIKEESQKSEIKEKRKESRKKNQKIFDDGVDKSDESIKKEKNVSNEDICSSDPGKIRNKSKKIKEQRNLYQEVDESVTIISKNSKKEKKNVLDEDISIANPEILEKMNKSEKKKVQRNLDHEINDSVTSISKKSKKEKNNVLDEDICSVDPETSGKKNKSEKKKMQRNLDHEINESITSISKKSKKEKMNVLNEDICNVDLEISEKRNKSEKKKVQRNLDHEIDESVTSICKMSKKKKQNVFDEDISIANPEILEKRNKSQQKKVQRNLDNEIDVSVTSIGKKSKKEKKNVLDQEICNADPEMSEKRNKSQQKKVQRNLDNIDVSVTSIGKKSRKEKKNVLDEDICNAGPKKELPEKKDKIAFKRKREDSQSEVKEIQSYFGFKRPKQDAKKRKVDSKDLKHQPFKNARKKILLQKTKKNFKA